MAGDDLWRFRDPGLAGTTMIGYQVHGSDGHIGRVDELTIEAGEDVLVVDTGVWIFGRRIALPVGLVDRVEPDSGLLHVATDKDHVKRAPEYVVAEGLTAEHRGRLAAHYASDALPGSVPRR